MRAWACACLQLPVGYLDRTEAAEAKVYEERAARRAAAEEEARASGLMDELDEFGRPKVRIHTCAHGCGVGCATAAFLLFPAGRHGCVVMLPVV